MAMIFLCFGVFCGGTVTQRRGTRPNLGPTLYERPETPQGTGILRRRMARRTAARRHFSSHGKAGQHALVGPFMGVKAREASEPGPKAGPSTTCRPMSRLRIYIQTHFTFLDIGRTTEPALQDGEVVAETSYRTPPKRLLHRKARRQLRLAEPSKPPSKSLVMHSATGATSRLAWSTSQMTSVQTMVSQHAGQTRTTTPTITGAQARGPRAW